MLGEIYFLVSLNSIKYKNIDDDIEGEKEAIEDPIILATFSKLFPNRSFKTLFKFLDLNIVKSIRIFLLPKSKIEIV